MPMTRRRRAIAKAPERKTQPMVTPDVPTKRHWSTATLVSFRTQLVVEGNDGIVHVIRWPEQAGELRITIQRRNKQPCRCGCG